MSKEIDYLTEDEPIQNQLFVCMSFCHQKELEIVT